jgi:hypothetical protein
MAVGLEAENGKEVVAIVEVEELVREGHSQLYRVFGDGVLGSGTSGDRRESSGPRSGLTRGQHRPVRTYSPGISKDQRPSLLLS